MFPMSVPTPFRPFNIERYAVHDQSAIHPLLSTPCRDTRPPPRYMYDTNAHPLHMPLHQASLPMCASHHLGDGQAGIGFSLALTSSSDHLDLIRGMLLGNHRHRRQSWVVGGGSRPPCQSWGVGVATPRFWAGRSWGVAEGSWTGGKILL